MIRDFSNEAYDELISTIESINNFTIQSELFDRINGASLMCGSFPGLFISAYNDMKDYQELYALKILLTKSSVDRIYQDVNSVSFKYRLVFENQKSAVVRQLILFRKMIDYFGQEDSLHIQAAESLLRSMKNNIIDEYYDLLYKEYSSGRVSSVTEEQSEKIIERLVDDYLSGDLIPSPEQLNYLKKYYDNEVSRLLTSYSGIKDIYYGDRYTEERMVALFRAFNPEISSDLDDFFSSAVNGSVPESDINNIIFIAMTAPEPFRSQFFNNLENVKLGNVGESYFDPDTKHTLYILTSCFHSETGRIDLCLRKDKDAFMNCYSGAYWAFFHEYGHALDYMSGEGNHHYSELYNDGVMYGYIYANVYDDIQEKVYEIANRKLRFTIDIATADMITTALIRGDRLLIVDDDIYRQRLYRKIFDDVYGEFTDESVSYLYFRHSVLTYNMYSYDENTHMCQPYGHNAVSNSTMISDMFCGVTNGFIQGVAGHPKEDEFGNNYWYHDDGTHTGLLVAEGYASYYAYSMLDNEEALQIMREYLPDYMVELDNMTQDVSRLTEQEK